MVGNGEDVESLVEESRNSVRTGAAAYDIGSFDWEAVDFVRPEASGWPAYRGPCRHRHRRLMSCLRPMGGLRGILGKDFSGFGRKMKRFWRENDVHGTNLFYSVRKTKTEENFTDRSRIQLSVLI
ncbi:hypothetical protein AAC387_Pa05g2941 [Persea americana]